MAVAVVLGVLHTVILIFFHDLFWICYVDD